MVGSGRLAAGAQDRDTGSYTWGARRAGGPSLPLPRGCRQADEHRTQCLHRWALQTECSTRNRSILQHCRTNGMNLHARIYAIYMGVLGKLTGNTANQQAPAGRALPAFQA